MNTFDGELLGKAPEFTAVLRSAEIIAATDVTVLIQGESGTGKELLARALHNGSRRANGPFVTINCAALPEQLAESELFGHKRGAFTGAVADNPGRVHAANGGTLFLDEIGELPLGTQAKLLRLLESGECQPVGAGTTRCVDARVVAATHRDLHALIQEGRFREDLYYRLNVVPLRLPALRERAEDIPLLVRQLTDQLAQQHRLPKPRYLPQTLRILENHAWRGNVRELRNFCERMLILLGDRDIGPDNLPPEMHQPSAPRGEFTLPDEGISLEELEQSVLRQALAKTKGNRSRAARMLGLTRDTFLYRLKKYAIE